MATAKPENESKQHSRLRGFKRLLGVGPLLLLGLLLEGLTILAQRWVPLPVSWTLETQILLTIPCVAACVGGMVWFNRTLNLVGVHLRDGQNELVTHGPFAYVRHPLYATLMLTIPPLFVIWFSDLLFLLPWALIVVLCHYGVRLEERGLAEAFGQDYEGYRKYVPALLPYKGAGGRRYREHRSSTGGKSTDSRQRR